KNGTTGKPSVGDDVVLIKFGQGMEEAGRTKTDANGKYTLNVPDDGGPHLVRDIHQGVTYNEMATPGTTTVDLQVYDVAKKVPGVTVNADVIRLQAESNQLEGVRFHGDARNFLGNVVNLQIHRRRSRSRHLVV